MEKLIYIAKEDLINQTNCGNKAHYLSKIFTMCHVPSFLVISGVAFIELLKRQCNAELFENIKKVFINRCGSLDELESIRTEIMNMEIPNEWVQELEICLNTNDIVEPYAVRSSSVGEDNEKQSGAGIYESYLNIKKEEIWDNIKNCWCSMFSSKAIAYSNIKGFDINELKMGVIIQHFVKGKYSGVIFSQNPITPGKGMVMEMVSGNGNELMAGKVSADTQDLGFYSEKMHDQEEWVKELMFLSNKLRTELGFETDIEWLIDYEGRLSILQCRPITALNEEIISEWIIRMDKIDEIPSMESGAQDEYIKICKRKKQYFYFVCNKLDIASLNNFFVRYNSGTDFEALQQRIIARCGTDYYTIRVNDTWTDIRCIGYKLSETLRHILNSSGLKCITVSIKYIPHNTYSLISTFDKVNKSVRVECVPGVMKGLKAGSLKPSIYLTNERGDIRFQKSRYSEDIYQMDYDTGVFSLQEYKKKMPDISNFIKDIAVYTKLLSDEFIGGNIEWWICEDKLYIADYSLENYRINMNVDKKDKDWISW